MSKTVLNDGTISITLGKSKMIWSAQDRRWVSDTSEMFQAAEELHALLDENDALIGRLEQLEAQFGEERKGRETALAELERERQKTHKQSVELQKQNEELLSAYETIAKLKGLLLEVPSALR
jgi:predicted  nucleic acid-binding Zn-ribbon protein